jgi:hypothetical protein
MQFGQVTAMGGSMSKRQRTSGGTYATMACRGGPFGTPLMRWVSRMFPDSTGPGGILDIFTPYHVGQKQKYAESSDASMGSDSDESENSPEVQGILGEALRSSKRLATMMFMKEFQARGSGGEQAGDRAEVERSLELSANCLAGMLGIPLPYPAELIGDVGVGYRDSSLTNNLSDSPSSFSIPAPTHESFLMAPITTSEIECRHVLHPHNPPSRFINSTVPSIPQKLGRIVKKLSRTMEDRPMWEDSSTVGGSVHQDDPVDSHMDEVLGTGTQEEWFLANPLLTPPLSPQNDMSSELEYVQSNSLSPAIPSPLLYYSESPPPCLEINQSAGESEGPSPMAELQSPWPRQAILSAAPTALVEMVYRCLNYLASSAISPEYSARPVDQLLTQFFETSTIPVRSRFDLYLALRQKTAPELQKLLSQLSFTNPTVESSQNFEESIPEVTTYEKGNSGEIGYYNIPHPIVDN